MNIFSTFLSRGRPLVSGLALLFAARGLAAPTVEAFDPNFDGIVHAALVQTDGSIVMGGAFTGLHPNSLGAPQPRQRLVKFSPDGSIDPDFAPAFDNTVRTLAMDGDGRLLVGGGFETVVDGDETLTRHGLARINPDGSVDRSFAPQFDGENLWRDAVQKVIVLADGSIVVGGPFQTVANGPDGTVLDRSYLVHLDADGTVIEGFNPSLNNEVLTLAALRDGGFVAGGAFTAVGEVEAGRLARFSSDGSLDTSWSVSTDNLVRALAVETDGSIVIGGDFLNLQGTGETELAQQLFLGRVSATGERETAYHPRPNARVVSLAIEHAGSLLVGGEFTAFRPLASGSSQYVTHFGRLTRDGYVDSTFKPTPSASVRTIALQEDGSMIVGGSFVSFSDAVTSVSTSRLFGARITETGRVDAEFTTGNSATIYAFAERPDGGVYIGGSFTNFAGEVRTRLALINADGELDPDYAPELNGTVLSMALQEDGKLIIGGTFSVVNEETQVYLARLNEDGSLDTSYDPQPNSSVATMWLESDGSLTVGGSFTTWWPNYDADADDADDYESVSQPYLARINTDGTVNENWTPSIGGSVAAMARQPDGKIVLGGSFTYIGAEVRYYLGRITADGEVDETFDPSPDSSVTSIAIQEDGDIVFGGSFTTLQLDDGEGDDDDEDDETDDDAQRVYIARVHADGSLDTGYVPLFDNTVRSLLLLPDGDLLVGGDFRRYYADEEAYSESCFSLIRLNEDGTRHDADNEWETNGEVYVLATMSDGDVMVGGSFETAYSFNGESIRVNPSVLRYDPDAGLELGWAVHSQVSADRYVGALTVQRSGNVLAAGQFAEIGGFEANNIARFTPEGKVDSTFTLRANAPVNALVDRIETGIWDTLRSNLAWIGADSADLEGGDYSTLDDLVGSIRCLVREPSGAILIGGLFSNSEGTSGPNLVRYLPDGTFDASFRPNPNSTVQDVAVLDDGSLIVVGDFTTMGGVDRPYIAKLAADGTLDTTFVPVPSSSVNTVVVQSDGKLLIGGDFVYWQEDDGEGDDDDGDEATDDDTRQPYFARLKTNGGIDRTFLPLVNDNVNAIVIAANGDITIGGDFTAVTGYDEDTTAYTRPYLARMSSAGIVDEDFNPSPNGAVNALALLDDGRLVMGGEFYLFTNLSDHEGDDDDGDGDEDDEGNAIEDEDADVTYLARLNADDTLDTSFNPTPSSSITGLVMEASGSMLVSGNFTAFYPNDADYGIRRNEIARVLESGELDTDFNPNPDDVVYAMLPFDDGSLLIGGSFERLQIEAVLYVGGDFTTLDDVALPYLARVQNDGNADGTYEPQPNGAVNALVSTPDGRLLVGGAFTSIFGETRQRLARLTSNGTLDTAFAPNFDGPVRTLATDQEGGMIVGGTFNTVNGTAREGLARLWNDGALDTTWAPTGTDGRLDAIASDLNGRVLVAGAFGHVAGGAQAHLARLTDDGALDTGFAPVFDGEVHSIVVRADGRLVVGGAFTTVNGESSPSMVILNDDGTVYLAGGDDTNGAIRALGIDREGRIVAGGHFSRFAGTSRALIARAAGDSSFGQALLVDDDGRGLTWVQTGATAATSAVRVAVSTDEGDSWTERGLATRRTGSDVWRWEGMALPIDGEYWVRVRGLSPSTQFGSGSLREYVRHFIGTQPSGYGYASTLPTRFGTINGDLGDWLPGGSGIVVNADGSGDDSNDGDDDGGIDVLGSRLRNLSTRVSLSGSDQITIGFVIEGSASRRVLLRAVGPGLTSYIEGGEMSAPHLSLHNLSGQLVDENTGWQSSAQMRSWFTQAGAFSLTPGSGDAVLAPVLAPGPYTLSVSDDAELGGIVLAELYDLGAVDVSDRLSNLSALGESGEGDDAFIVGFVIEGSASKRVLIRGVGPGLTAYGVGDALSDVGLSLYGSGGVELATNEAWTAPAAGGASAAEIAAAAQTVGAFALASDSADAALLVELPPGTYTVQLHARGETGTQGLIEIYEVVP